LAIDQLQTELQSYQKKGYLPSGYDKINDLHAKLKETELRNQQLVTELKHMHKIQHEQGKALEKITDENDYPSRIKTMVEELRCSKERNRALEQKLRVEEKSNKSLLDQVVRVEEALREIRGASKRR